MWKRTKDGKSVGWLLGTITILGLLLVTSTTFSAEVDEIRAAIMKQEATWTAEENEISALPPEERVKRLGLLPPGSRLAEAPSEVFVPPAGFTAPSSLNWRNNGGNFVSPVKNQGSCGSCWAFATTAALESKAMITFNSPGNAPNLSEQIVVSCSGAGSCDGGYITDASSFLVSSGTNKETCYPYRAANGYCGNACSSWTYRPYRISGWSSVSQDVTALKNAIAANGPVIVTMAVYTDFYYYSGGVYHPTWGYLEGYHAILAVGYDDAGQYFMVKNSWGTGWGLAGYFKIAYSEVSGSSYSDFAYQAIAYGDVGLVGVNLLDPNGGEAVGSGESYPVSWEAPGDAYAFKLYYSLDNGTTWKLITDFATGSSYGWSVPVQPANKAGCRVKIQEIDGSYNKVGEDKSALPFTIEVVGLTSPNGFDYVPSGGSWPITWTTHGTKNPVDSVKLYYSMDNGTTWKLITTTGDTGSYLWSVPTVTSDKTKCKVKVVLKDAAGKVVGSDISNYPFTITTGPI